MTSFNSDNSKWSKYKDDIIHAYEAESNYSRTAESVIEKYGLDVADKEGLRKYVSRLIRYEYSDKEILSSNIKLAKQKQKLQDVQRVERKSFREHARAENAIEELNRELIKLLKKEGLKISTKQNVKKKKENKELPVIIAQLSDLHGNTLIDTSYNKFDFYVLAKRLKKFSEKLKSIGKFTGSKKLFIANLGDISTSNRRYDEILNFCTNITKANQIIIRLLKMFIIDLNEWFDITIAGVTGNESRTSKDLGFSDITATDNHDFTIHECLRQMFEGKKGVDIRMMKANEEVAKIKNKNFLLMHGHTLKANNMQKSAQEVIGKYSKNESIQIDYILSGHIHSTQLSDYYARNSSMVGADEYATEGLNFASRAGQNIHLVYERDIDSMRIDLQDTTNIEGYDLEDNLREYSVRSANKQPKKRTILEIVI